MGMGIKSALKRRITFLMAPKRALGLWKGEFVETYQEWRTKRLIAILEHYGLHFFEGKTVLEVGAGFGDIGGFISEMGAKVVCTEGRATNLAAIRRRFKDRMVIHRLDLNRPDAITKNFDVIIHLGVLYHLQDYMKPLQNACAHCQHLILETEVADSDDPNFVLKVKESFEGYDQALDGLGCRPSAAAVEKVLTECGMAFERITDSRCNGGFHYYDWPVTNSGLWKGGQRRFWFAHKI